MGLDMYLSARRYFEPESDDARNILAVAGITLDGLETIAKADPFEHDTSVYLPMWEHADEVHRQHAASVIRAAGLLDMVDENAPSGTLGYQDGKVYVDVHCYYWRKANAVHAWFVDNCQAGVDECQATPVSAESLTALANQCTLAITAHRDGDWEQAERLMPPTGGFFFGSLDMDEWWVQDLGETVAGMEKVVRQAIAIGGVGFIYQSSW